MRRISAAEGGAWPLPGVERLVPARGSPGSFWEDRGDRRHCGVDLYAPAGSKVASIGEATVLEVGPFTNPRSVPYWNETLYLLVEDEGGRFFKLAELASAEVRVGDRIESGQILGRVGSVLNPMKIDDRAPAYIRGLKDRGRTAMLHLELYASRPESSERYRGGNWFGPGRPRGLLDPTDLLIASSRG